MTVDPDRSLAALNVAARAHEGQQDPGTGFPYVTHPMKVALEAQLACRADASLDEDLVVCCALLHDVVEDTPVTLDEIRARFGDAVADGVAALTKDSALPKEQRTADSLSRILRQPREIACVKLADRITNLEIAPPYWSAERKRAYAEEARAILAALGGASVQLSARLTAVIARYESVG